MAFCLLEAEANRFKEIIERGDVTARQLTRMTSEQRRQVFSRFTDSESTAKSLNTNFERKMLQENRDEALLQFVKEQAGIPQSRREQIIADVQDKIKQQKKDAKDKRIFNPSEDESFLEDLSAQRLGFGVTREESAQIFKMSKSIEDGQELLDRRKIKGKLEALAGIVPEKDRKTFDLLVDKIRDVELEKETRNSAKARLRNYFKGEGIPEDVLKELDTYVDKVVKADVDDAISFGTATTDLDDFIGNVKEGLMPQQGPVIQIAGAAKTMASTGDLSFGFRQGLPVLAKGLAKAIRGDTDPLKIWGGAFINQFKVAKKAFGDENTLKGVRAVIASRKNAIDGLYQRAKLDVGITEEAFPSTAPEKIPALIGQTIRASNQAYTATAYRLRSDMFDYFLDKAVKEGNEIDDNLLRDIGSLVNSMTGRGDLKLFNNRELAELGNVAFFSPRFMKSQFDKLLLHPLGIGIGNDKYTPQNLGEFKTRYNSFAAKEARDNLGSLIGSAGVFLGLTNLLFPDETEVEIDPRSSDFGKLKIGDSRFDVTGGVASVAVLAARLITETSKSVTTGTMRDKAFADTFLTFFENKLAPFAGAVQDAYIGEDFTGNNTDVRQWFKDGADAEQGVEMAWHLIDGMIIPIPAQGILERYTDGAGDARTTEMFWVSTTADLLGIGNSYYKKFDESWHNGGDDTTDIMIEKYGKEEVKEASLAFTTAMNDWMYEQSQKKEFIELKNVERDKFISKEKAKIKKRIKQEYGLSVTKADEKAFDEKKDLDAAIPSFR